MHAVLRATPLVLVLFCGPSALSAPAPMLTPMPTPPIFEPPRTVKKAETRPAAPPLPVSGQSRVRLNAASARLLAATTPLDASAAAATATAATPSSPAARDGDPIVMPRYLVKAAPLRIIERDTPDPPLLDFLKTGRLYHHFDGRTETIVALKMLILKEPGLGAQREYTQARLDITFRR